MPNRFCHVELGTKDIAKARKFYQGLFKWKLSDFHGGYTLIDTGEPKSGGGMMQNQSPKQPSAWMPYVEVDDVRKAIAKAKKLGAKIGLEYMEIPDGMGSFGYFTDPTGAALGVWSAAKPKKGKK
jgi:uncharacterized protein